MTQAYPEGIQKWTEASQENSKVIRDICSLPGDWCSGGHRKIQKLLITKISPTLQGLSRLNRIIMLYQYDFVEEMNIGRQYIKAST